MTFPQKIYYKFKMHKTNPNALIRKDEFMAKHGDTPREEGYWHIFNRDQNATFERDQKVLEEQGYLEGVEACIPMTSNDWDEMKPIVEAHHDFLSWVGFWES
jgi:hypothetical protein